MSGSTRHTRPGRDNERFFFPTLRRLDASHAPTVTDDSLPLIVQLPYLKESKLGSVQVTDDGLQSLAAWKSIRMLVLGGRGASRSQASTSCGRRVLH